MRNHVSENKMKCGRGGHWRDIGCRPQVSTCMHTYMVLSPHKHTHTKGQPCVRSMLQCQERRRVMRIWKTEENLRSLRQIRHTFITTHYEGRNLTGTRANACIHGLQTIRQVDRPKHRGRHTSPQSDRHRWVKL